MAEQVASNVCGRTGPAPGVGRQTFWPGLPATPAAWADQASTALRGWAEFSIEVCAKLRESLAAQLCAGLGAIEAGFRVAAAKDPEAFRARLADYWQKSFACLGPVAEVQAEAARFAAAWALHVATGMRTVREAEYQRRLALCRACEFFQDNKCLSCGCRVAGDVIAKARWAGEQCPLGKWEAVPVPPAQAG
jgi:hypothetical protein